MMKAVVNALRAISVVAFIFTLYWLLSIIIFQPWKPAIPGTLDPLPYPITIGDPEINIWNAFIYFFMYTFGIIGHLFSGGMVAFPFSGGNFTYFWDNYTVAVYYFGFEVCIVVAVISMVMFLRKCNPEWSFRAFLFLIGMLILVTLSQYAHMLNPRGFGTWLISLNVVDSVYVGYIIIAWIILLTLLGIFLFKKAISNLFKKNSRGIFWLCFALYIIPVSYASAGLFNTIPSFYVDTLSNSVVNMDFVAFVTNPIFLAAFFTFLFLEITYLTSYNYEVTKPSLEREHAITERLEDLRQLGERSTEELQAKAELHSISIRRFFSSEAFDFMREVIERGVYDKEVQARMASFRDYQRLQTYLDDLYVKDPEARSTLTAKASFPPANKLAKASFVGTLYRVLLVFLLILVCFSPFLFFDLLAFIPSSIPSYLEIQTVAGVIIITIPLVLLFPTIGGIIKMRRMPKIEEVEIPPEQPVPKPPVSERSGIA